MLEYLVKRSDEFRTELLHNKLLGVTGIVLTLLASILIAGIVAVGGIKAALAVLGLVVGLPLLLLCIYRIEIGLLVVLVASFFVNFITKFVNLPIGILLDGLSFLLTFLVLLKLIKNNNIDHLKEPLSFVVLLWMAYTVIQVANPAAGSIIAWVYTVRSIGLLYVLYFVAATAIDSYQKVKWMLAGILGMSLVTALYGFKQEFLGFSQAELNWLYADQERFNLIVQWGRFRVFSFCSDPTTFGVLMAFTGVISLILAFGPFKTIYRVIAFLAAVAMFVSMIYGGSRTPVLLVPIGLVMYTLLTMKKEVIVSIGIFMLLGIGVMLKSTSNPIIFRIQTALSFTKDASMQVRLDNQKAIQPFIWEHPFGGGIGSSGVWGRRFTPDSPLAYFAHDSGLVRVAVEMGWIGLMLYSLLLGTVMWTSIKYYFRTKNPQIKSIYLAITCGVFILVVGSYPQEVLTLLPNSIIYYILLGIIVRLHHFDKTTNNEISL